MLCQNQILYLETWRNLILAGINFWPNSSTLMACSGPARPPERMFYVLRYHFSPFSGRQKT